MRGVGVLAGIDPGLVVVRVVRVGARDPGEPLDGVVVVGEAALGDVRAGARQLARAADEGAGAAERRQLPAQLRGLTCASIAARKSARSGQSKEL